MGKEALSIESTRNMLLQTGQDCTKSQYIAVTGQACDVDGLITAHMCQSFKFGEITMEESNCLDVEFVKRFTKGNHGGVV